MTLNISRKQSYSMKDMLYVFHHNADRFLIVGLVITVISFYHKFTCYVHVNEQ